MTFQVSLVQALVAVVILSFLGIALYKRWSVIVHDRSTEVHKSAPLAKTRAGLLVAAVLLLVIIGITAALGASVAFIFTLLYGLAGIVALHVLVSAVAGFREGRARRDGGSEG